MKNYYKILQVNKNASQDVIAKVYKVLAKKYHPDTNLDNKEITEEKFKEISEAYEILSDENKRKEYDIMLEEYEKNNFENPQLQNLRNYCTQLEQEMDFLKNENNKQIQHEYNYNEVQKQNLEFQKAQQQIQAEAFQQAYNDAYINTLKNMGYKIKYKQSFKQRCKNFICLIFAIIIIAIILRILWQIPAVREFFIPVYDFLLLFKL